MKNSKKINSRDQKGAELLEKRLTMDPKDIIAAEKELWTRSAPADLYYQRDSKQPLMMRATQKLENLCTSFEETCIKPAEEASKKFNYQRPVMKRRLKKCNRKHENHSVSCSSSSESSDDEEEGQHENIVNGDAKNDSLLWIEHRKKQEDRLSDELWENRPGEVNDGPACRCSLKHQKVGIRHGVYQGEENDEKKKSLDDLTNNSDKLFHYRITITPPTNFLIKYPTVIEHDGHEFIFEGFSLFTTEPLKELPVCKVLRFNIEYSILYFEEKIPDNFILKELKLFHKYLFTNLLELVDWDIKDRFHFMPRFVRDLNENGKEILSMNEVLKFFIDSYKPLIDGMDLMAMTKMNATEWLEYADKVKGMIVTFPGKKPGGIRVDQLDREQDDKNVIKYPEVVHFGTRPPQLCYAGNPEYLQAWREFVKFRHLVANMAKPSFQDKRKLDLKEDKLTDMRNKASLKRDVTVAVSSEGFFRTGIMTDIAQHAMLLPVLVNHLRLHASLDHLESRINYQFKNRFLLQLALTHPSYRENFGTVPDHARNSLSNCGIRQPEYGDKKVHFQSSRKRGINMLINIMSKFGRSIETESKVHHNERLEFLGDAVVEFITSVHLFHMFPDLEEGGLATYRAALVQNHHLAILAGVRTYFSALA